MIFTPHPYQTKGEMHLLQHPRAALFIQMGLGKTIITLSAIWDLIAFGEIKSCLVVAPPYVGKRTWPDEICKWDHLKQMTYTVVAGMPGHRKKLFKEKTDVHFLSWELLYTVTRQYDMIVFDESSYAKSRESRRFKAAKKLTTLAKRVVLLSGTPAPNSLMDLWAPLYLLDGGQRLEYFIGRYREKYFKKPGFSVFAPWVIRDKACENAIHERISDICLSMKAKDYLKLPKCTMITVPLNLGNDNATQYKDFVSSLVLELPEDTLTMQNALVMSGKLLQYTSGAIYDEDHHVIKIHEVKMNALKELVDIADSPVLIFYSFKHELERIKLAIPKLRVFSNDILAQWNKGEIPVMAINPRSCAHGLNLQYGGHIAIWYSPIWSLELFQQANARLNRIGQEKPVAIYQLIMRDTIDERVLKSLDKKDVSQESMLEAIKAIVEGYRQA